MTNQAKSHPLPGEGGGVLAFGPFRYDPVTQVLEREGEEIRLPPRVLGVVERLLQRPRQVVSKQDLLDAAWGNTVVAETSLTEAIKRLRRALEDDPLAPTYVQTVHRRGYKFIAEVTVDGAGTRPAGSPAIGDRLHAETSASRMDTEATIPPPAAAVRLRAALRRSWAARRLAWGLLALLISAAAVGVLMDWRSRQAGQASSDGTLTMALPDRYPLAAVRFQVSVAISRDGSRLVYVAQDGASTQLVGVRIDQQDLDAASAAPIPNTHGALFPAVSPDGNWVAFMVMDRHVRRLKKVSLQGGPAIELAEFPWWDPGGNSLAWGADGKIYFTWYSIHRVGEDGGEPEELTTLREGEGQHRYVQLLPDGEHLIYATFPYVDQRGTVLLSLETGEEQTLVEGSDFARYLPTGHLGYRRGFGMFARRFDLSTLEFGGEETPFSMGINSALADEGTLVGAPWGNTARRAVWVDRSGRTSPMPSARPCTSLSLSPDGEKLALNCLAAQEGIERDVWVSDLDSGEVTRIAPSGEKWAPIWTPDGKAITYSYGSGDGWWIVRGPAQGSGGEDTLWRSDHPVYPQSWSPDGKTLAFIEVHPDPGPQQDIWLLSMEGDGEATPLARSSFGEWGARFSPDGKWIAYATHETIGTDPHIYVVPYPALEPRLRVSTWQGSSPAWSSDGRELFYWVSAPNEGLARVEISYEPEFSIGDAELLFEKSGIQGDEFGRLFEVAPDGQRFAMIPQLSQPDNELYVVPDLFEELRRLLPTER